jgi:hypothetical protein
MVEDRGWTANRMQRTRDSRSSDSHFPVSFSIISLSSRFLNFARQQAELLEIPAAGQANATEGDDPTYTLLYF